MEDIFEGGGYKLEDRAARWIEATRSSSPASPFAQASRSSASYPAALKRVILHHSRPPIRFWPLWQTPVQQRRHPAPHARNHARRRRLRPAYRLRQRRNLLLVRSFARRTNERGASPFRASRSRLWKQLSPKAWCLPLRRHGRAADGVLVPTRAGPALPRAPAACRMHLPGKSIGAFSPQRRRLPRHHAADGPRPALQTGKIDLADALKMESAGSSGVAAAPGCAPVYAGASLRSASFCSVGAAADAEHAQDPPASPGFNTRGVQDHRIDLSPPATLPRAPQTFQDALLERVRSLPGVESAAFARMTPLSYVSSASAPHSSSMATRRRWRNRRPGV